VIEKLSLLRAYQEAIEVFGRSVGNLYVRLIDLAEYERLANDADQAKKASVDARGNLQKHITDHGC